MSKETTENFWKAMAEPPPDTPLVFYRLYYNNDGTPICYTMEDLPGNYIEVDQQTYVVGSHQVKVVDKKIIAMPTNAQVTKLRPSKDTGIACDPKDVCVVVSDHDPHVKWSLQ